MSNNPAQLVSRAMVAPQHLEEPQADLPPKSGRQPNDGHIVSKGPAERRPALAEFNSMCGETHSQKLVLHLLGGIAGQASILRHAHEVVDVLGMGQVLRHWRHWLTVNHPSS